MRSHKAERQNRPPIRHLRAASEKFVRHKPEKVGNSRVADGHLGSISGREGVEMLGGTFEVEAKSGIGTRARSTCPYKQDLTFYPPFDFSFSVLLVGREQKLEGAQDFRGCCTV